MFYRYVRSGPAPVCPTLRWIRIQTEGEFDGSDWIGEARVSTLDIGPLTPNNIGQKRTPCCFFMTYSSHSSPLILCGWSDLVPAGPRLVTVLYHATLLHHFDSYASVRSVGGDRRRFHPPRQTTTRPADFLRCVETIAAYHVTVSVKVTSHFISHASRWCFVAVADDVVRCWP